MTLTAPAKAAATPAQQRMKHITADPAGAFGAVADHFGTAPDEALLAELARLYEVPGWVKGSITFADAWFLAEMIRCTRPEWTAEAGVASGMSSAAMLVALKHLWGNDFEALGRPRLESFDLMDRCYFNAAHAVGDAARQAVPHLMGGWRLRTGMTTLDAGKLLAGADLPIAFIDADHRHPWPIVDVLAMRPAMRPGAWIVLHDIELPETARRFQQQHGAAVDWGQHGVKTLFDAWPYEKLAGVGPSYNIGAVRLPDRGELKLSDFDSALAITWEAEPGDAPRDLLGRPAHEEPASRRAAEWVAKQARSGHKVVLYGMGQNGRGVVVSLRGLKLEAEVAWADDRTDAPQPRSEGMTLRRIHPGDIPPTATVLVTPNESDAIVASLVARGVKNIVRLREI